MEKTFSVSVKIEDESGRVKYAVEDEFYIDYDDHIPGQMTVKSKKGLKGRGSHVRRAIMNAVSDEICNIPSQINRYYRDPEEDNTQPEE